MDVRQLFSSGIYAITGEKFSLGRNNLQVVKELLDAGVKIIQYREKYKNTAEKYKECLVLREMTKKAGACFIINDNIDLAILTRADGVHVGQEDLPVAAVRSLLGPNRIIGLSTRTKDEIQKASRLDIDYIGVGPIYSTQTKDDAKPAVGLEQLDYTAASTNLPFVAIGGIKVSNVAEVFKHGCNCAAMITELVGVKNIAERVEQLRQQMGKK